MDNTLGDFIKKMSDVYRQKTKELEEEDFEYIYSLVIPYINGMDNDLRSELKTKYNSLDTDQLASNIAFDIMYDSFNLEPKLTEDNNKIEAQRYSYIIEYMEEKIRDNMTDNQIKEACELYNCHRDCIIYNLLFACDAFS